MTRCVVCGGWLLWLLPWVHWGEHRIDGTLWRWHGSHRFYPNWREVTIADIVEVPDARR